MNKTVTVFLHCTVLYCKTFIGFLNKQLYTICMRVKLDVKMTFLSEGDLKRFYPLAPVWTSPCPRTGRIPDRQAMPEKRPIRKEFGL